MRTVGSEEDTAHCLRGFTLIELLVVISIIGLLASVVMASLNSARAKGRDAKRLAEMDTLRNSLELYYDDHGYYPPVTTPGGSLAGWEVSFIPDFLEALTPYLSRVPVDPTNSGPPSYMFAPRPDGSFFYMYYNYPSGSGYGCPWRGPFAVLGFRAVEGMNTANLPKAQCGPVPCTGGSYPLHNPPTCRDWSGEFDYSIFLVR